MVSMCVKIYTYAANSEEKYCIKEKSAFLFVTAAAQDSYLSVVGDTPINVLHPFATHGTEAYLQLLRDHITAET